MVLFLIAVFAFSPGYSVFAQATTHLLEGIKLYNSGNFDEALNEFKAEMEINANSPLVYYYAAHIRLAKGQYTRAIQNLEAALRDSSNFYDAQGLLAYVYLKTGENTKALVEWTSFVHAVGIFEEDPVITVNSIMLPEDYREILKREARIKELEALEAEKLERENLLAAEALDAPQTFSSEESADPVSINPSDGQIPEGSEPDGEVTEIQTPLADLEQRIQSSIRSGIIGIIAVGAILGLLAFAVTYWIKKRNLKIEDKKFSSEVERLMSDKEYEVDEEKAIREFENKRRDLALELQSLDENSASGGTQPAVHPVEEKKQIKQEIIFPESTKKTQITEEIKSLVSRLFREGHTADEIANTADLTKTEVDLILAVREHHMEKLVEEISNEEDNGPEYSQIVNAVNDLSLEGTSTRDIAKKLNISLSEVKLAASVIEMQKTNSGSKPF